MWQGVVCLAGFAENINCLYYKDLEGGCMFLFSILSFGLGTWPNWTCIFSDELKIPTGLRKLRQITTKLLNHHLEEQVLFVCDKSYVDRAHPTVQIHCWFVGWFKYVVCFRCGSIGCATFTGFPVTTRMTVFSRQRGDPELNLTHLPTSGKDFTSQI